MSQQSLFPLDPPKKKTSTKPTKKKKSKPKKETKPKVEVAAPPKRKKRECDIIAAKNKWKMQRILNEHKKRLGIEVEDVSEENPP